MKADRKGKPMVDCWVCGEPSSVRLRWLKSLGDAVLLCCMCEESADERKVLA